MHIEKFEAHVVLQAVERVGLDVLGQFVLIEASYLAPSGDYETFRLSLSIEAAQELKHVIEQALVERVFLIDKN